ncbi:MAG: hypothetical protein ACR2P9_08185 [Gammaproteobacteria bacterium]
MDELITKEINKIIQIGQQLATEANSSTRPLDYSRKQDLSLITARGGRLIEQLYGTESTYFRMFEKVRQDGNFSLMRLGYNEHVNELVGIFKAIKNEIESGMLADLHNLMRADIFADILGMAEHLHSKGYIGAAAILIGATLEDSLRKLADTNGVSLHDPKGKPRTIDPLNIELAKKGIYDSFIKQQITSWASLRNDAVHGHFKQCDPDRVENMLRFVQQFCSDHLK